MTATKPKDIDAYIAGFSLDVQVLLQQIRATIKTIMPNAVETIKYKIPTFTFNGNLIHFAAFKYHIGVYPAPTGDQEFKKELAAYKTGKGSVRFSLDQPIPFALISKIVKFNANRNLEKVAKRKSEKKAKLIP